MPWYEAKSLGQWGIIVQSLTWVRFKMKMPWYEAKALGSGV